jgi:hypothetical protein
VSLGGVTDLVVYAATLVVPLGVVAWTLAMRGTVSVADLGVRWPHVEGLGPVAATAGSVVAGLVVAAAGYWAEKAFQEAAHGALPVSSKQTDVEYLMDGADGASGAEEEGKAVDALEDGEAGGQARQQVSERRSGTGDDRIRQGQAALVLAATGFAAVAEEGLWRGYLLAYAQTMDAVTPALGLVVAAVAFGSNHAYFGWRNVLSKSVLGLAWGGLFLATGSLVAPVVSHLAFNALALDVKISF